MPHERLLERLVNASLNASWMPPWTPHERLLERMLNAWNLYTQEAHLRADERRDVTYWRPQNIKMLKYFAGVKILVFTTKRDIHMYTLSQSFLANLAFAKCGIRWMWRSPCANA